MDTFWAKEFPAIGTAATANQLGGVTDSAASATALATGWKTRNGVLGMRPDTFLGGDTDLPLFPGEPLQFSHLTGLPEQHPMDF